MSEKKTNEGGYPIIRCENFNQLHKKAEKEPKMVLKRRVWSFIERNFSEIMRNFSAGPKKINEERKKKKKDWMSSDLDD